MTVHLLKLAVGAGSIDELRAWVARSGETRRGGRVVAITTRSAPKRLAEVLDGGCLFWVIRGSLAARQRIVAFEPFTDAGGTGRFHVFLAADVVPVRARPCRPFQGWRYLEAAEAPADAGSGAADEAIPAGMRRALAELCLI
jgi:hypothetical protein